MDKALLLALCKVGIEICAINIICAIFTIIFEEDDIDE